MEKIKCDPDWDTSSKRYDKFNFIALIEKTILAQIEYQYPFATVYEQEVVFYIFHQQNLNNDQWCERFNTKVDIGSSVGITRQHKVLLEYVSQESNIKYDDIST